MKFQSAYVETSGSIFANGRPGRPGKTTCEWPRSCRPQPCLPSVTSVLGATACGANNKFSGGGVGSLSHGVYDNGSGYGRCRCKPLPPVRPCFDGVTQVHCSDRGCRTVGHTSFSAGCCPRQCRRPRRNPWGRPSCLPLCPPQPCPMPFFPPFSPCAPFGRSFGRPFGHPFGRTIDRAPEIQPLAYAGVEDDIWENWDGDQMVPYAQYDEFVDEMLD